jgi:hypothetical protein
VKPETLGAVEICPWLCGGPDTPTTPFLGAVFLVIDSFRVLIAVGAATLIVASVWAIRKADTRGQKCRFLYVSGTALIMAGTEVQHLGDVPNWRFLVSLVTVAIGAYGVYQHLFRELPARDRT